MFNQKKAQIKPTEKMLDDSNKKFDLEPTENPSVITDKQLERKNMDGDKIGEKQLKEVRVEADSVITEKQLNAAGDTGINKKRRDDGIPLMDMGNEYQKDEKKKIAKEYRKQDKPDEDTAFWDSFLDIDKPKIVGNVQRSQLLSNYDSREEMNKKNPSVNKKSLAALKDADAMLYHIYRVAASESREITAEEKQMICDINSAKIRVLSQQRNNDPNEFINDASSDEADMRGDEIVDNMAEQMPQSIDVDSLNSFTKQYIGTALWSSTDNSNEQGGEPLDSNYGIEDISTESLREMISDCSDFQQQNDELLQRWYTESGEDPSRAGHDFWLTRNGHGAGFWDRHMDEPGRSIGDQLTKLSKPYGSCDLYVGDDGVIYVS